MLQRSSRWRPAWHGFRPPPCPIRAVQFLEHERQYLLAPWTPLKVLFALSVPAFLAGLAWAFWARSWRIGLLIANAGCLLKIWWSFHFGGDSGWTVVPPAALGMVALNGLVLWVIYRHNATHSRH